MPKLTEYTDVPPLDLAVKRRILKNPDLYERGILTALYAVFGELDGPENIAGDGEFPPEKVAATYQMLYKRRDLAFRALGGSVDDNEILDWGAANVESE